MSANEARSITLPAPRNALAVVMVGPWILVSLLFSFGLYRQTGDLRALTAPAFLLGLPAGYLLYEALYSIYGFEVLTVTPTHLASERRLFGRATRRRRYLLAQIEELGLQPLAWYEHAFQLNLAIGFDEGLVSFWCGGRWVRVAEGLRGDECESQAVVELLYDWISDSLVRGGNGARVSRLLLQSPAN